MFDGQGTIDIVFSNQSQTNPLSKIFFELNQGGVNTDCRHDFAVWIAQGMTIYIFKMFSGFTVTKSNCS